MDFVNIWIFGCWTLGIMKNEECLILATWPQGARIGPMIGLNVQYRQWNSMKTSDNMNFDIAFSELVTGNTHFSQCRNWCSETPGKQSPN